jgi:hypothetical protein
MTMATGSRIIGADVARQHPDQPWRLRPAAVAR